MEFLTRTLRRHERAAFTTHLQQLDADDRRLRFGLPRDDASIAEYVNGIDYSRDSVVAVFDSELCLIGAAHIARGQGYAEVGLSVLSGHRGRGIGSALLERSRLHARNWGVSELFTHCAADNGAMMRLARKHGMRAVVDHGDADAYAAIPAPDASSFASEMFAERIGISDYEMKSHLLRARRFAGAFFPAPATV